MKYKILISRRAQKQLAGISNPHQDRIINSIRLLAENPRPRGARKLTGREGWRVRTGNYRIIYEIHEEAIDVLVVSIGHRREIYRKL